MAQNIKLTSTPECNTPFIVKFLKDLYQQDPNKAVGAFMAGYRLTKNHARGVLSGSIPTVIDETAETVTLILS